MPKYTVASPLDHNGKLYQAGDIVSLDKAVAAPLVDVGVLCAPAVGAAAVSPAPAPLEGQPSTGEAGPEQPLQT